MLMGATERSDPRQKTNYSISFIWPRRFYPNNFAQKLLSDNCLVQIILDRVSKWRIGLSFFWPRQIMVHNLSGQENP